MYILGSIICTNTFNNGVKHETALIITTKAAQIQT